ncbi:hypothetical protein DSL72_001733 [Monilinia vaccinii-corymbosi]|uniref:Uncharacterized protein n=1 Tax=Monilinia vaccinii-corymbosi TaxID=61207 RepID=A0A8A3P4H4_9HELO|nr:hypothetical protein DSL72_001733 [Monilinia vaccinii-corymbosi]
MCTTYFSTYANCHHRPFRRTRCAFYAQDRRTCSGKVEVRPNGGLVCPVCFDKIVWVRSNGEWEMIETPAGELGRDDWEEVERAGYDWQENRNTNDVKGGVERSKPAALGVTKNNDAGVQELH